MTLWEAVGNEVKREVKKILQASAEAAKDEILRQVRKAVKNLSEELQTRVVSFVRNRLARKPASVDHSTIVDAEIVKPKPVKLLPLPEKKGVDMGLKAPTAKLPSRKSTNEKQNATPSKSKKQPEKKEVKILKKNTKIAASVPKKSSAKPLKKAKDNKSKQDKSSVRKVKK